MKNTLAVALAAVVSAAVVPLAAEAQPAVGVQVGPGGVGVGVHPPGPPGPAVRERTVVKRSAKACRVRKVTVHEGGRTVVKTRHVCG